MTSGPRSLGDVQVTICPRHACGLGRRGKRWRSRAVASWPASGCGRPIALSRYGLWSSSATARSRSFVRSASRERNTVCPWWNRMHRRLSASFGCGMRRGRFPIWHCCPRCAPIHALDGPRKEARWRAVYGEEDTRYVPRAAYDDWSAYREALSAKLRYEIRRGWRRLKARGAVSVHVAEQTEIPTLVDWLLDQKRKWLVQKSERSAWGERHTRRRQPRQRRPDSDRRISRRL